MNCPSRLQDAHGNWAERPENVRMPRWLLQSQAVSKSERTPKTGLSLVKHGAVLSHWKVMCTDNVPVLVVLTPAAATLSCLAELPEGVIPRDQPTMGIILFMIPVARCDDTCTGTGSHLLKVVAGWDLEGAFKAGHGFSSEHLMLNPKAPLAQPKIK